MSYYMTSLHLAYGPVFNNEFLSLKYGEMFFSNKNLSLKANPYINWYVLDPLYIYFFVYTKNIRTRKSQPLFPRDSYENAESVRLARDMQLVQLL